MSSSENRTASSGSDVLDEHKECLEALIQLEGALNFTGETAGEWIRNLRHRTIVLRRHMQGHFCREEQSRLLGDIPIRAPHLADRLDALAKNHEAILGEVDALVGTVQSVHRPDEATRLEIKAQTLLVIASLRRHEADENEIIMTAFWTDEGGRG